MLEICKIPVVTPYPVGPVNCYLVNNDPLTLLDPGPGTDAAKNALKAGLSEFGVELSDIKRVMLTHSHLDHSGLAPWVRSISGAQIYMHRLEVRKLDREYDFYLERLAFFQEAGLPADDLNEILSDFDPVGKPEPLGPGTVLLDGGENIEFDGGAMTALHFPGHSDGHICLYDREGGCFLAGDFILKEITPNPNMEPDSDNFSRRLPTLRQYLDGLSRLEKLMPRLIMTGHGENITDCKEAVKIAGGHHDARLRLVHEALKRNKLSVYQLMRAFYPKISGFEIYLGVSELFAHVDYLVSVGKALKLDSGAYPLYQAL